MIPLRILGSNLLMKGDEGSDVGDLHVLQIGNIYVSRWEPTPDELEILKAGGSVQIAVLGGQPPIMLTAVELEADANSI